MQHSTLTSEFEHYSTWRDGVSARISGLRDWLAAQALDDADSDLRLSQLLQRLHEDTLNIAFVAEFSRGKSELINAIFFADYQRRILPSSAGRTTMCPTELYFDATRKPSLRLLPINTRAKSGSVSDYKLEESEWHETPLNIDSAEEMSAALMQLAETIKVSGEVAEIFDLFDPNDAEAVRMLEEDGVVEIPRWRHALINFPHPLLKQGLVILDTPGLNAIGTEPELTLNLLPNAHAVLFLLAADTGVTRSDIEIWRNYIAPTQGASRGRLVVLNKIDGLWDDLKSPSQVDAEINKQIAASAKLLELPVSQIYPVSAQKALVAKIRNDAALLGKSRLPELESALSNELIPHKQELVRESSLGVIEDVVVKTTELLETRLANIQDQVDELQGLRGKNRDVILLMMTKANADKLQFERGLQQFNALRNLFSSQVLVMRGHIGMDALRAEIKKTRLSMEQSHFSKGLLESMRQLFRTLDRNLQQAGGQIDEIQSMMAAMYQKFSEEHGLASVNPPTHSLHKYRKEMARLERVFDERFNTVFKMLTLKQSSLTARFFETLAKKVVEVFESANRETEGWLKALIAPMETQVREHKSQLKHRLESVSRIHAATETLDERIQELETSGEALADQIEHLARNNQQIMNALNASTTPTLFAQRA